MHLWGLFRQDTPHRLDLGGPSPHARFGGFRTLTSESWPRFQQARCCSDAGLGTLIVKPSKGSASNEAVYDSVERPDDHLYNAARCMIAGVHRRHCLEELLTVVAPDQV